MFKKTLFTRRSALALTASATTVAGFPSLLRALEPDVLRVASLWEWRSNEPTDTGHVMTRMQIAETLVVVEPDGQLVGGVAESWSVDDDKLTWRFNIRPGVSFHDGTPVTAAAAADCLKRAFATDAMQKVPVDFITTDGETLILKTVTPFGHLPAALVDDTAVMLAPASFGADGRVEEVIATGPFRITAIDGKTVIELERFEDYWGEKPNFPRARYTAIPNPDTIANVAIAGDQDIIFVTPPTATPRIDAAGQMQVESVGVPRARVLNFNCGSPMFTDARVRRAVSMAVDRGGIASAILRHPASNPTQLLPPVIPGWYDPDLTPYAFDVEGANALLDEAGWEPDADGVREKDGVRLSATILTYAVRAETTVMATAMQAQLKDIGMELAVEPLVQSSGIVDAVNNDRMEMVIAARSYHIIPDPIGTIIVDFTNERAPWGSCNWSGREQMKALTDEYVQSFDEVRRAELRHEIVELIQDEVPVVALSWFEHTVAIHNRIRGLVIDPFETRYMLHTASLHA